MCDVCVYVCLCVLASFSQRLLVSLSFGRKQCICVFSLQMKKLSHVAAVATTTTTTTAIVPQPLLVEISRHTKRNILIIATRKDWRKACYECPLSPARPPLWDLKTSTTTETFNRHCTLNIAFALSRGEIG